MSSSGVSSNAKSTATINQDEAQVRDKKTIHTLQKEKLTLEADKAELERNMEKKVEEVTRQQLRDLVEFAQKEGFPIDQIKSFAAMKNLYLLMKPSRGRTSTSTETLRTLTQHHCADEER